MILDSKNSIIQKESFSYSEMSSLLNEAKWKGLQHITVEEAINRWLDEEQNINTCKNYRSAMGRLIELGMIDPFMTLQQFSLVNVNAIVTKITCVEGLSRATRQARAAAFLSFTRYLSLQSDGFIKRALPQRTGSNKTFYKVREIVATDALSMAQWTLFLDELYKINPRDALIAKLQLQGAKRISEVLRLTTDAIDYQSREITFPQSKTRGTKIETIITFPQAIIDELRTYIGGRIGLVFVTKSGKRVLMNQVVTTYAKAGERAGFKMHTHMLRCSAITYLMGQGFQPSEVAKITGQTLPMVAAYDKRNRADNPTKKISLVM